MYKNVMTNEEQKDVMEVRDTVIKLPENIKKDIAKGMAMFEAGYKSGFIDGVAKKEKTA